MRAKSQLFYSCLVVCFATLTVAGPPASIEQLEWMTGNWIGSIGPNKLEENWLAPEGGSIVAAVRMRGEESTAMFEFIVIEEADESLVLRVQQFGPGFAPRSESAQKMELVEIGERMVKFKAVDDSGFSTLAYSRPSDDEFLIQIERPQGGPIELPLKARSLW